MMRLLHIVILQIFIGGAMGQSFTINDLNTLANLPGKKIHQHLYKQDFILTGNISDSNETTAFFTQRMRRENLVVRRNLEFNFKNNSKSITLYTSSIEEYLNAMRSLIKAKYFYDTLIDITTAKCTVFQKANIIIKASAYMEDGAQLFKICLTEYSVPSFIRFAEDLMQFNSHQFLSSYFGEENVRMDMYYLSEKELKRCSVLFSGTPRQALFIWDDERSLSGLAYIIITNSLPTEAGKNCVPLPADNEWKLKNGLCAGMSVKEVLKINEVDFEIYGNKSELSNLVKPNTMGKINFAATAVVLDCKGCFESGLMQQESVSALEIAKANIPMRVFDIVLYPSR